MGSWRNRSCGTLGQIPRDESRDDQCIDEPMRHNPRARESMRHDLGTSEPMWHDTGDWSACENLPMSQWLESAPCQSWTWSPMHAIDSCEFCCCCYHSCGYCRC